MVTCTGVGGLAALCGVLKQLNHSSPPWSLLKQLAMDSERLREQGLRSLLRLQEQGLATAATLRPERNPVDDAFKPPDEMAHSYMVASSKPSRVIQAKAVLHVPPSLARELRHTSSAIRPSSASRLEGSSASQPVQHHGSAMRSVRRWDMLPKHAWLMASESGQAPGPGFREVSPTRPIRPFGPNALSGTVTTAAEAAAPRHDGRDAASHATLDASSYMSASVGAKRPPVSMMERKAALEAEGWPRQWHDESNTAFVTALTMDNLWHSVYHAIPVSEFASRLASSHAIQPAEDVDLWPWFTTYPAWSPNVTKWAGWQMLARSLLGMEHSILGSKSWLDVAKRTSSLHAPGKVHCYRKIYGGHSKFYPRVSVQLIDDSNAGFGRSGIRVLQNDRALVEGIAQHYDGHRNDRHERGEPGNAATSQVGKLVYVVGHER